MQNFAKATLLLLLLILFNPVLSAQSVSKIDSLKTSFEEAPNDSLKVIREISLAKEIHRREHNAEIEYRHAQEAVNRALQLNDTVLYALALDNLGLLYRYHQQYNQALALHTKAFEGIKHKDTKPLYKMIFANNAGVAARYNHNYDTSVLYYMQALKIAEEENDLKNIAISTNGIGNALSNMPDRQNEALPYFKRSLAVQEKTGNQLGVAMNYLSIGDYYTSKGAYRTAHTYFEKLLGLNKKRNDLFGLAITYEYIGISHLKEGKYLDKAVSYFQKSIAEFKLLDNKHRQAEVLIYLGDTYLKKDNFVEAKEYYQRSLSLSKQLNDLELIRTNAYKLSELSEQNNDYKAALSYAKLSQAYKDSIKLNEQNVKIEALTQEYNLVKKENQIQFLEKDKALQQAVLNTQQEQLERRQIIAIFLAIGLGAILIIFFLQYRNYRTKKLTNQRISQAEKEKMNTIYERNLAQAEILVSRLRLNPHFLFNCLNAINYLIQSKQNSKAIQYLEIFSHYTRMVLETSKQQVIPLQEEIELAEHYLMLEENRFAKDFKFHIEMDDTPEIEDVLIPPLLLQPFLENAIWHGLMGSPREEKILKINIHHKEDLTQVIIDDNGAGRKNKTKNNSTKAYKSMGMTLIKERIALYNKTFNGEISYEVVDKKDSNGKPLGTQIILKLQNTANHFPYYNKHSLAATN
ncbi:tetratricopeptide repeat-containing sensor histidine kinase [Aequorivita marina]|uniref:tetratricopeptide repeat-containing sensor histidine kinase n=1 Tax=Aequorivita marina TaxID=3073654 RepID=UPI00287583C1|nr:tetratricopeptide repeat protein [Aequorivita sp. S2608]MDS1297931.1 tetratricopeptide repeat protein [Aequorivita sp. S2608]